MDKKQVAAVMSDPYAVELLGSSIPARLAYTGRDGFPRAIPIGFHWNGTEIVAATSTNSAKVPALQGNPKVALTIDTNTMPPKVLLVRGTATIDIVDGVPDDYLTASRKIVGAEMWEAFEAQVRGLYQQMARIAITPEWAKILDFETRLPQAVEELVNRQ